MIIIPAALLFIGTVALAFWNFLMFYANSDNESDAAHFAYRTAIEKYNALANKYNNDVTALDNLQGFAYVKRKFFHNPKSSEKKMKPLEKSLKKLDAGNFNGINFLALPGYGFIKLFNITADFKMLQNTVSICSNLKGREFAVQDARHLLATVFSCAIGGVGLTMVLGVLIFAIRDGNLGLWVAILGALGSVFLAYALYDDIKSKARKRTASIMKDFAQAVTELALLTSSGMEMFRAWREACVNPERTGPLYCEMRQVIGEIDNGVQPAVALENFIVRCGTKETSRLGASILQNLTRGNDELSKFLEELSKDVWEERKHTARQLGEQAKSKLMLPMGLIFFGILIIVGVAVITGMSGMDM